MATATFEVRKFRDIEVVVNKADPERPINLTKLAASLTGSRQSFKDVAKSKGFWKIVDSYVGSETIENKDLQGPGGFPPSLETLLLKRILAIYDKETPNAYKGIYGPTWLADWIVVNFKPEFFKQIHELFEVVERVAELRNESFGEGVESIIESKEREIKRLTKENSEQKSEIEKLNINLEKTNKINKKLLKELRDARRDLHKANENIDGLNDQLHGTREEINRLNHNLSSFTPLSATTHSISFILRLYVSDLHPRRRAVRARAVDGKIWICVYCGEEANFTKTIRDANARIVATFPVNSRDTLAYISTRLIGETVEEAHYKHWLVQANDLPNLLDSITDSLLNNDVITGNVETNHDLIAQLMEIEEPEDVVPDPIEPPRPEYDFAELAQFEYYYKNRYRELREDAGEHRLYFHVGNAGARVREYVNPEAVLRLRRRHG